MIRASVSNLDKYAAYLNDDEYPLELLLRDLRGQTPRTPAMERGHAFAKAMEVIGTAPAVSERFASDQDGYPFIVEPNSGEVIQGSRNRTEDMLVANGHAFAFTCNAEIEAWPRRELKGEKDYGGIIVSARCDRLHGNVIADDKSTSHFSGDAGVEKYIDKKQWRYYLDIFGAHEFVWHIWETREIEFEAKDYPGISHAWEVWNHHVVRNYRYPELENECKEFALAFKDFAERIGIYS